MFEPAVGREPLNVVIAGSEAFPFAKTGGLDLLQASLRKAG